jgi:hypothetical protein
MMTDTKHTQGPWVSQSPRGHQRAIGRKWEVVAPLDGGGELVIVGENTGVDCLTQANANLIAAAPDMLEALKALMEEYVHEGAASDALTLAMEAIAKAEGR